MTVSVRRFGHNAVAPDRIHRDARSACSCVVVKNGVLLGNFHPIERAQRFAGEVGGEALTREDWERRQKEAGKHVA